MLDKHIVQKLIEDRAPAHPSDEVIEKAYQSLRDYGGYSLQEERLKRIRELYRKAIPNPHAWEAVDHLQHARKVRRLHADGPHSKEDEKRFTDRFFAATRKAGMKLSFLDDDDFEALVEFLYQRAER